MSKMKVDYDILDVPGAAELIGIHSQLVYRRAAKGLIPHFRVGAKIIFRRSVLLAWMEKQEKESMKHAD